MKRPPSPFCFLLPDRKRFVVTRAGTIEAGLDDLSPPIVQFAFQERANLLVEKFRQNCCADVVAFDSHLRLRFYLKEPMADRLPFDLNGLRRLSK